MPKSVGLDPGEYEVKVVELDGSYRKPKLLKASVDRVAQLTSSASDPGHAMAEAEALQHAIKKGSIHKMNVCLGFSSREAVFRQLTVPFTGEDRIRKVIKFEAEGEIHSQSVDDMVIDFHIVDEVDGETNVLVAGVPKQPLSTTLTAVNKVGIDPERVDLDMIGLYRIADFSGALSSTPAEDDVDTDLPVPVGSPGTRLVLDVGARAVRVLVVSDGHLRDMRAIPLGCDSAAEDIAKTHGLSLEQSREALIHCLTTGSDYHVPAEDVDEDLAESDEEVEEVLERAADTVSYDSANQARERLFSRLRREFMRFLVSVKGASETEAVYTTGGGSLLPGITDLLADVFQCTPEPIRFLHNVQHTLEDEDVEYLEPRIAVAVGLALGQLGGIAGLNFRQEELVFTRGFDRIKLPLAVACMLGLFYFFFHGVALMKELDAMERQYGMAVERGGGDEATGRRTGADVETWHEFTGYLGRLVNRQFWASRRLEHNEYRAMVNRLAAEPPFARLDEYLDFLDGQLNEVEKEGQYEPELALESGLSVLQQFSGVIKSVEDRMGRFYIGDINLRVPDSTRGRTLSFEMYIRGADFRAGNEVLFDAFKDACEDADSAFQAISNPRETRPRNQEELGLFFSYDITLKDKIPTRK